MAKKRKFSNGGSTFDDDMAAITAKLKAIDISKDIDELSKSKSAADRDLARSLKQGKEEGTDVMIRSRQGKGDNEDYARKVGPDGRAIGPEYKHVRRADKEWEEVPGKAKGGVVQRKIDGIATKGKTRGRLI